MPNHIHILWQMQNGHKKADVQRDLLKYTAQQIKFDLQNNHLKVLEKFKVNIRNRDYQFWEHRPLSIDLWTEKVFEQKLNYIHENPLKRKVEISSNCGRLLLFQRKILFNGKKRLWIFNSL
jgi:REP element-mobilizing transposase RayT